MSVVTEDYVKEGTAKLLKEQGFDVPCMARLAYGTEFKADSHPSNHNEVTYDFAGKQHKTISLPTIQMAMKWLLEKHNLHIQLTPYPHEDGVFYWGYKIAYLDQKSLAVMAIGRGAGFDTKADACDAAINKCIENFV